MADRILIVLVLEDEAAIGIQLEDELEAAGYGVAGPFATCAGALKWLESQTPDLAVLDTILTDGSCKDLAAELTRRGVPFVMYSGALQDANTAHEFMEAVWIEKPAPFRALLDALANLKVEPKRQQS